MIPAAAFVPVPEINPTAESGGLIDFALTGDQVIRKITQAAVIDAGYGIKK